MKKLLLALSIISLSIQAESDDSVTNASEIQAQTSETAEQDQAALIAFVAKFKALHTMSIREYAAVEKLFNESANTYIAVYDHLETIDRSTNPDIQIRAAEIKEQIDPLGQQLASILDGVKDVNVLMQKFNTTPVNPTTFNELTRILVMMLGKLTWLKKDLESVLQQEVALESQALALIMDRAENQQ